MSAETEVKEKCCTSCGKAEIDDVKLMDCDRCDLARYCGVACRQNHLEIHESACNERAAKLRDEILFKQPESSFRGDCPICFLPMPFDDKKSTMTSCCAKIICNGCVYANLIREREQRLKHRCPFCRKPANKTDDEACKMLMKRAEANDPVALRDLGRKYYDVGDYDNAFKYWTRAAELGGADAHCNLAEIYGKGHGVEEDEEKEIYHLEEAAIAGHPIARCCLGCHEEGNDRYDRAVKHWIIAANLGDNDSINELKECYKYGHVSKDDLAAALRAYHAAVEATKSPQREAAARHFEQNL